MTKCLIFDLDNTLIEWKDEYIFALVKTLKKIRFKCDSGMVKRIDMALEEYENHYDMYYKDKFLKYVNDKCNINLPSKFVDILITEQGKCYEKDKTLVDVIKYLSKKYDLIVLSNWFVKTQKLRLKGAGIYKYFKYVSGGDERVLKPSKEAFDFILKEYEPCECIMIGDSIKYDINPAIELGMRGILLTDVIDISNPDCIKINSLELLKEVLSWK